MSGLPVTDKKPLMGWRARWRAEHTPPLRARSSRLFRIWCLLWYGHDHEVSGKKVEVCGRCGADIVGDGD